MGPAVSTQRRSWRVVASVVAFVIAVTGLSAGMPATQADAATGDGFNAGNIISDAVFYNSSTMSAAQIQGFIDARENCRAGYVCLENYYENTYSRGADAQCGAYAGVAGQRASDIIWNVAQVCGINPQVLLVLLEKEQGLVSDDWPSPGQYRSATGYGCPDTAPCDAEYYGFYNQVYKAAWQYERYRLNPGGYNYRAGRVNTIQWNPNTSCNSSQVYIENQATAGLYIYTPYRPNQAALNNMYGVGDSCSSYGNRNFYRIFTDWFGSTQGGSFIRTADNPAIYLLVGNTKYPVVSSEVYNAYAALGPFSVVSAATMSSYATGRQLGQLVRDITTSEIFYTDLGVKHYVTTCEQLVDWKTNCSSFVDLNPSQISALQTGAPLGKLARAVDSGAVYLVTGGTRRWIRAGEDLRSLTNGNDSAYINIGPAAMATLVDGPDYIGPGNILRLGASQYLMGDGVLHPLQPSGAASDFTTRALIDVSASNVAAIPAGPAVGAVVSCGSAYFIAGGGRLWPLQSAASRGGLPATALGNATCAALPRSSQAVTGSLFLLAPTTGAIYYVNNGQRIHMVSMDQVTSLNGGAPLVLVPASNSLLAGIPITVDPLPAGVLVKSASAPEVYFVDGPRKVRIDSFATAAEFGVYGYRTVDDDSLAAAPTTPGVLTLAVTCGSTFYIAGSGQLWRLDARTSFGLPTTDLTANSCTIPKSGQAIAGQLFLRAPDSGAIYHVENGQKVHMTSMAMVLALNGGTAPVWVPASQAALDSIPDGAGSPVSTQLVKAPESPVVYMIDGARKVPIDSFETLAEFGISGYSETTSAVLSAYSSATDKLSLVVKCGSDVFIAGSGQLWRIQIGGGFGIPVTTLDSTTCAALARSGQTVTGDLFLRSPSTGEVFHVEGGRIVHMTSMAQIVSLNGGSMPVFVPVSSGALSRLPS